MKTSIFDATFTLPLLIEMTQVEKEMPMYSLFCYPSRQLKVCV